MRKLSMPPYAEPFEINPEIPAQGSVLCELRWATRAPPHSPLPFSLFPPASSNHQPSSVKTLVLFRYTDRQDGRDGRAR